MLAMGYVCSAAGFGSWCGRDRCRRGRREEEAKMRSNRLVESQNVATGPCPRKSVLTLGLPSK